MQKLNLIWILTTLVLSIENVNAQIPPYIGSTLNDPGWKKQSIEEDGGPVVAAVAIGVLQDDDPPTWLALVVHAQRVVAHFHDPEFAVRTPVKRDRALDQRRPRGAERPPELAGGVH